MARTPLRLASALAATTLAPSVGHAQSAGYAPAAAASFAKSDAILGGTPSRLAAILAQQQGLPAPTAPVRSAALQPASRTFLPALPAVLRAAPAVSRGAVSGRPDIFGSVALPIRKTPLDRRWKGVAGSRVTGAAAAYATALRSRSVLDRVEAVNRYVNQRITFVDDSRQYGSADLWTAASTTLNRGRGDCEDYAIAKLQMLRAAGVADRDLYLVVLKDLTRRADHAVLVVRAGGRMLVLDNGTDVIADSDSVRDYRPVITYAAAGSAWTHGYRRILPPVQIAAAAIAPLAPSALSGPRD